MIYVFQICKDLCFVENFILKNFYIQNFFILGLFKVVFFGDRYGDFVIDLDLLQCSVFGFALYEYKYFVYKVFFYYIFLCEYSIVLVYSLIENFIMIGIQRVYFI